MPLPEPLRSGDSRLPAQLLAASAMAVIAWCWMPEQILVDDAWITFRYAENLAAGHGLVYNVGEPHLGTTAPLLAILLALLTSVTGLAMPTVVAIVHVLATAAAGVAAARLARGSRGSPDWLVGFAFVVLVSNAPWMDLAFGMETALFVALGLWMIDSFSHRRGVLLGVAMPLLTLLRPDGVLLGCMLLVAWWRSRGFPTRTVLAALAVGLPWVVYAWCVYGSPVPHSAVAKIQQSDSALCTERFFDGMLLLLPRNGQWLVTIAAAVAAGLAWRRRDRAVLLVLGWGVLHNGTFAILAAPAYPWYYAVYNATTALLAAYVVVPSVANAIARLPTGAHRIAPAVGRAVLGVALLAAAWVGREENPLHVRTLLPTRDRYWHLGNWIAEHTPASASIAMTEVGIVGYVSRRRIVDLIGLVTPGVSEHFVAGRHVDVALRRYDPDYFIAHLPVGGHEHGLQHRIDHGFLPVHAIADVVLYSRWSGDESALARRLVDALGDRRGNVVVTDFPAWLDFPSARRATTALEPGLALHAAPARDVAWIASPTGNGTFAIAVAADVAPVEFDRRQIADQAQPVGLETVVTSDGARRCRKHNPAGHLRLDLNLTAPLRRVRVRFRVDEVAGDGDALGTLAWTTGMQPGFEPRNAVTFPVEARRGPQECVAELPAKRFHAPEVLRTVMLSPLDRPCEFVIESITFERH